MVDKDLIKKMLTGQCSPNELEALQDLWTGQDKNTIEQILRENWNNAKDAPHQIPTGVKENVWAALEKKRRLNTATSLRVVSRRRQYFAIAASLTLLLAFVGWSWWSTIHNTQLVEVENENRTPKEVQLADGSTIWLRTGSKLTYFRSFEKDVRNVTLDGEAFFDVAEEAQLL
ncbi:MAG: FecR domain-containing protein, partial [Bacteroidota bacterium]